MWRPRPRRSWRLLCAALAAAALVVVGCGGDDGGGGGADGGGGDGPAEVAALFSQSGANVGIEQAFERALKLAVEENPGIVDVKYYDTASDPATGVQRYQEAVTRDGRELIFGPIFTPIAIAVAEQVESGDTLMFTPGTAAPSLTDPTKPRIFTLMPTTAQLVGGEFELLASMGVERIGVIYETDEYGEDNLTAIESEAEAAGIEIAVRETIGTEGTEAASQIAAMADANVDAVVVGAIVGPTQAILQEAQKQRLDVPILNTPPGLTPAITEQAMKREVPDFYATSPLACPIDPALVGDCAQSFSDAFEERFGEQPGIYEAVGYVGALAFLDAVERADGTSPDAIAESFDTGGEFQNEMMPGVSWTADDHLGASEVFMQGIVDGELSFFGKTVDDNELESGGGASGGAAQ